VPIGSELDSKKKDSGQDIPHDLGRCGGNAGCCGWYFIVRLNTSLYFNRSRIRAIALGLGNS